MRGVLAVHACRAVHILPHEESCKSWSCGYSKALRLLILSYCSVSAETENACQGNFGPDYFNFTSSVLQWSEHLPEYAALQEIANHLTSVQEQWLVSVCSSGFSIQDCPRDDPKCEIVYGIDGYGYIHADDPSILKARALEADGHISCCSPLFWEELQQDIFA
jgi:hypothetical protein